MLRVLYPNSPLSVDGIYGQATKTEVEKYQKDYGLPITGVVDQATWDDMRKSYQRELVLLNKAEPLQIVLQPHQVLKSGSDNIHMYLIQALLTALHRFSRSRASLTRRRNGRSYGSRTRSTSRRAGSWISRRGSIFRISIGSSSATVPEAIPSELRRANRREREATARLTRRPRSIRGNTIFRAMRRYKKGSACCIVQQALVLVILPRSERSA